MSAWNIFNDGRLNRFTGFAALIFVCAGGCKDSSDKEPMERNVMEPENP